MLLSLVTPCLIVAVQPCMEWIPIKKIKSNWWESNKHLPKMKSTIYHWNNYPKVWKVSEEGKPDITCLLACLPACFVSTKKFSAWVYWQVFCCFWLIKPCNLSHMVWIAIFPGIFLSFLLCHDLKILVKSR